MSPLVSENSSPEIPAKDAGAKQKTFLVDANSGQYIRVLDPADLFFIERSTGQIDVIAKDRAPNFFRRDGVNIKYADRGVDVAPKDSEFYVTIEEVEELVVRLEQSGGRAEAQAALTEDERREPEVAPDVKHITENDQPVR